MGEKLGSTSGCRKLGGAFGRSLECPQQTRLMVKKEIMLADGEVKQTEARSVIAIG